jgi:hypothetical protein
MSIRDQRDPFRQVVDLLRYAMVGAGIGAVVLVVDGVRSWGSTRAVIEVVVGVLLGVADVLLARRLLRD